MSSVALSTDELEGLLAELRYFKTKFPRALKYTKVLDKTYSLAAGASTSDTVILDSIFQFTNLDILIFGSGTASGTIQIRSFSDTAKVKAIPNSTASFTLSVGPGSTTGEWNFYNLAVGDRIPLAISNADTTNPNTITVRIWIKLSD